MCLQLRKSQKKHSENVQSLNKQTPPLAQSAELAVGVLPAGVLIKNWIILSKSSRVRDGNENCRGLSRSVVLQHAACKSLSHTNNQDEEASVDLKEQFVRYGLNYRYQSVKERCRQLDQILQINITRRHRRGAL